MEKKPNFSKNNESTPTAKPRFNLSKYKAPVETATVSPHGNQPKKKSKWWLWLLVALVAVGVVVFLVLKPCATTEDDAAQDNAAVVPLEQPAVQEQTPVADSTVEGTTPTDEAVTSEAPASGTTEQASTPTESTAPQTTKPATPSKQVAGDVEQLALDVIRGSYGNGSARKAKLGERYAEIQRKVNQVYQQKGNRW
jgi:cytoskeletal protein RodZ